MQGPDLDRIKKHLHTIVRPRDLFENHDTLLEVESYLEDAFHAYGYHVRKDPFSFQGKTFHNLIAHIPSESEPQFIIGAHFDAVPGTPGADDNASGVVALLEAARVTAPSDAAKSIEWIAFNAEEYGMVGSSHYVESLKEQKRNVGTIKRILVCRNGWRS